MIAANPITIKHNYHADDLFGYNAPEGGMFFSFGAKTLRVGAIQETCREIIQKDWRSSSHLGFRSKGLDIRMLDTCWRSLETKLDLLDRPTIFHRVERPFINEEQYDPKTGEYAYDIAADTETVIVELNPFWTSNTTRKGFMTLFLRLGAVHYRGKYRTAIQRYDLANEIAPAIDWFLAKNTQPTYRNVGMGIVETLRDADTPERLSRLLVKPAAAA